MESVREITNKDLSCEIKFQVSIEAIVKLSKIQSLNDSEFSFGKLFENLLERYVNENNTSQTKHKRDNKKIKILAKTENYSQLEAPKIVRRNMQFFNEQNNSRKYA